MKRNIPVKPARPQARRRKNQPVRLRTYTLMFVCGLLLVSGFFFAARQHFASMDYGMKNSRLRKQVEELEAEKRRLLLAREVSLSPGEIKRAAKKTGLADPAAAAMTAQVASATKEKAAPQTSAESRTLVIKTSAVSSTMAKVDNAVAKTEKPAKSVKGTAN
jgi:hypothetical protein